MTQNITSPQQLEKALATIVEEVIVEVSKKVSKRLQENIEKYTYDSHPANKWYYDGSKKRTGEFERAWKWDEIKKTSKSITRQLYYDWQSMSHDAATWKHGSVYSTPQDVTRTLPEILNKRGKSSKLNVSVNHEPFWDITIYQLFNSKEIETWFEQAFKARGINVTKGGYSYIK